MVVLRAATEAGFDVTVFFMPILPHLTDSMEQLDDALILMRGATHLDARRLAVQRIEDDQRLYNRVLDTLGCATTRPTAL